MKRPVEFLPNQWVCADEVVAFRRFGAEVGVGFRSGVGVEWALHIFDTEVYAKQWVERLARFE